MPDARPFDFFKAAAPPKPAVKRGRGRPCTIWDAVKNAVLMAEYAIYRATRTLRVLAEKLGVTLSYLYKRASRMGLSKPQPRKKSASPKSAPRRLTRKTMQPPAGEAFRCGDSG